MAKLAFYFSFCAHTLIIFMFLTVFFILHKYLLATIKQYVIFINQCLKYYWVVLLVFRLLLPAICLGCFVINYWLNAPSYSDSILFLHQMNYLELTEKAVTELQNTIEMVKNSNNFQAEPSHLDSINQNVPHENTFAENAKNFINTHKLGILVFGAVSAGTALYLCYYGFTLKPIFSLLSFEQSNPQSPIVVSILESYGLSLSTWPSTFSEQTEILENLKDAIFAEISGITIEDFAEIADRLEELVEDSTTTLEIMPLLNELRELLDDMAGALEP